MQQTIGDSYARRDGVIETSYPRGANPGDQKIGVGTTINTAAWTWTAYAVISNSGASVVTTTDFVASAVAINLVPQVVVAGGGVLQALNGEIELATGAAGSEVAFATIPWAMAAFVSVPGTSTNAYFGIGRLYPLAPKFIPTGTRVVMRARQSIVNTQVTTFVRLHLIGYDGGAAPAGVSTYTLRGQQTGIQKGTSYVTPAGSTLLLTPIMNGWGAWTQVVAATTGENLFMGVATSPAVTQISLWHVMEIGTGAAAAEVVRARVWFPGVYYCNAHFELMPQPLLIKPGERVAVRVWSSVAAFTLNCQFLLEQH